MDYKAFCSTIRQKFKEFVTVPTKFPNAPWKAPADSKYCVLTILTGESMQKSIGVLEKFDRTPGVAIAQVFCPSGTGTQWSHDVAILIKANFQQVTYDGVVFKTPTIRDIGFDNGLYQLNVNCPFYVDNVA